ncbi:hypothetical protein TrCOL_g13628 [Triparma columacea]|uniref:Uncharacterized protein n=1 Tax=Triparma columacea TaxID=722753 RepID=A0A9W7FUN9_9STRA|nr:hypothetical protein TrCOL_g13628 [Triparma columacea]
MLLVTFLVRVRINKHFVSICREMTLATATMIDLEELRDGTLQQNGGKIDNCYTVPSLRRDKWELEPKPYRKKSVLTKRDAFAKKRTVDLVEHDDLATPDRISSLGRRGRTLKS